MATRKAAFFDVDGTLIPRPSLEVRFAGHLAARGVLTPLMLGRALVQTARHQFSHGTSLRDCPRFWLAAQPLSRLQRLAGFFYDRQIRPRLLAPALSAWHECRNRDYRTVLLSGAPEFLLLPMAEHLGADAVAGTRLEVDSEGRILGSYQRPRPCGAGKTTHLLRLCARLGVDPRYSAGFANEASDVFHLTCLGQPVAVRPDRQLALIAGFLGWETLDGRGRSQGSEKEGAA